MSQKQRPNANYKLSKPDYTGSEPIPHEDLTFYYNRERRLAKAPQSVQELYAEVKPKRFGFFGSLVSSKPKVILFITIVMLCVAILLLSITGHLGRSYVLDGNQLLISGARYHGTTIITINKSIRGEDIQNVHTGAVDVAVTPAAEDENAPVFFHRLFFTLEPEEEYTFVVPFEAERLVMIFETGRASLRLIFRPD